jgi:ferrochelatase
MPLTGARKMTTGVLLLNLGGPDSLKAVRPFLYNIFSDREIIRLGPPFLQKPIAWLISRLRSKKTEGIYRQIGGKSPILDITVAQAEALEKTLNESEENRAQNTESLKFKVYIGMRYWHPFMKDTVRKITNEGVRNIIVLTLYPHYSKATTGSSVADFKKIITDKDFSIKYIDKWYDFPPYIDSLAEKVAHGISECEEKNLHILYSAHSLPQSFIDEGDPYLDHIKATIEKVNERLASAPYNISELEWHLSFQSKAGPVKWLEPSTEEVIVDLSKTGCKNLFVVPVSFVSDHIETLYEIDILYKKLAEKYGTRLRRCEALNTSDSFIHALKDLVLSKSHNSNA